MSEIAAGLAQHQLVPRIDDALDFASKHQVLLFVHEPSEVEVDLSLAWLSFELEAIRSAETIELAGVRVPVARPEDLVIYKAIAWRAQDQQDVERLLTLHGNRIDLNRVRQVVSELTEALDEPERVHELDTLARRAKS